MSATFSPFWARLTERFVDVSVLPVPPFGPRMQTSREFSLTSGVSAPCLRAMSLWISKRICSGVAGSMTMSSAPASNARRRKPFGDPWPSTMTFRSGPGARRVEEQQRAIRVAGAGDEEQVRDASAQPRERLLGSGDDADDVEVLAAGQRVLDVLGVDSGFDGE